MEEGTTITCTACGLVQPPQLRCAACGAPLVSLVSKPSRSPLVESSVFLLTPRPPPPVEPPPPPPRRSWMAVSSLVSSLAFWPALLLLADTLGCQRLLSGTLTGTFYVVALGLLLGGILLGGVALIRIKRSQKRLSGQRFAQLGVSLGMMNVLLGIGALPTVLSTEESSRYDRSVREARAAVSAILQYAHGRGAYPPSLKALREGGFPVVRDKDPWGNDWVLAPVLSLKGRPGPGDDVVLYSRGPRGTGRYTPGNSRTGPNGAAGYSSVHGGFRGC